MKRYLEASLIILLGVGLGDSLWLFIQFWSPGPVIDGITGGIWTALAFDFSQGYLYRPVFSDFGYGGTRYMPLFFMFHGMLIRLGLEPSTAGAVAMQTWVLVMMGSMVLVLRQAKLALPWAVGVALLTCTTTIFTQYLSDTNCEYMAAALSILAFYAYQTGEGEGRDTGRLSAAALLSALAFFVKFTTLYAPATIVLHLALQRRFRTAALFAVSVLILMIAGIALVQQVTGGLFWENMKSSATAGTDLGYAMGFLPRFLVEIAIEHPAVGMTFLLALIAASAHLRVQGATPIFVFFVMGSLDTMFLFVSLGIAGNHIVALHAVSLLIIGATFARQPGIQPATAMGFLCMAVVTAATWLPFVPSSRKSLDLAHRETKAELLAAIQHLRPDMRPILTDHGAVTSLLGQRTVVLDNYNLARFMGEDPSVAEGLRQRLKRHEFSLLVLLDNISDGAEEMEAGTYEDVARVGRFRILRPVGSP